MRNDTDNSNPNRQSAVDRPATQRSDDDEADPASPSTTVIDQSTTETTTAATPSTETETTEPPSSEASPTTEAPSTTAAPATTAPLEPLSLRTAVGEAVAENSAMWYAIQAGFYDDLALEVTNTFMPPTVAPAALASGEIDLVLTSWPTPFNLVNQGMPTSVILNYVGHGATGYVTAVDGIESVTDCKKVVSFPVGSGPRSWAQAIERLFEADFEYVEVTDPLLISASLASGQVDCAVSHYGAINGLLQTGEVHLLVDPRDPSTLPDDWPEVSEGVAFTLSETLEDPEKREAMTRFVAGTVRALEEMKASTPDEVVDVLLQNEAFAGRDRAVVLDAITSAQPLWFPDRGYITEEDFNNMVQFHVQAGIAYIDPASPNFSYDQRIDMSLYEENFDPPAAD